MLEYKIISPTLDNIFELESLRLNAYGVNGNNVSADKTFYSKELVDGKYLVFGAFIAQKLVGACYVKDTYNSLYIDQLFVQKKYQRSSKHIGSGLLRYVLENKEMVEEYFKVKMDYSYLDDWENTYNFYQGLGYRKSENLMKRRL